MSSTIEESGEAGGGMAKVVMTGKHEVRRVTLDPSIVSSDDKDMLEDLVAAKGATSMAELERWQQAWDHAADRTPHGQPIEL